MAHTVRRRRDGLLTTVVECTSGFPARALLGRKLGAGNLAYVPASCMADGLPEGDAVCVLRQDSDAWPALARAAGRHKTRLSASGYRIHCVTRGGRRLLIVAGGDLFGMLAGLSDLLQNSEFARAGLVYRGDARTETPAFPLRFYWTWDHSTNWVLDDTGNQLDGCGNEYLKRSGTYAEDYRRLVDHCVDMRFNGIVIWGFLRDAHGAEASAEEVARYAADRGVAILPGVGTTSYGGVYYEGKHPYNLEHYLSGNPKRGMIRSDGSYDPHGLSPYQPDNLKWMQRGLEWLYSSFRIGGVNLENGDLLVDYSRTAKLARARIRSREADYFKDQYFAYKAALETCHTVAPGAWNTYATYSGFGRGSDVTNAGADMGVAPHFSSRMPASAIAQWTLTGMLRPEPLPLRSWMGTARPRAVYDNPRWPRGLRPPTPRSAGFLHQASQWHGVLRRGDVAVSTFAEACLRSHEAGLEGISVHGEATSRFLPCELNYLAMRHWSYHPHSTLEQFAAAELAPRLGGQREASAFVEALCLLEDNQPAQAREVLTPYARRAYPHNSAVPWRRTPKDPHGSSMWCQLGDWIALRTHPQRIAPGSSGIL